MHDSEALVVRLVQFDLKRRVKRRRARGDGDSTQTRQRRHQTYRNASSQLRPANIFLRCLAHRAPSTVHVCNDLELLQLDADADWKHFVLKRAQITS